MEKSVRKSPLLEVNIKNTLSSPPAGQQPQPSLELNYSYKTPNSQKVATNIKGPFSVKPEPVSTNSLKPSPATSPKKPWIPPPGKSAKIRKAIKGSHYVIRTDSPTDDSSIEVSAPTSAPENRQEVIGDVSTILAHSINKEKPLKSDQSNARKIADTNISNNARQIQSQILDDVDINKLKETLKALERDVKSIKDSYEKIISKSDELIGANYEILNKKVGKRKKENEMDSSEVKAAMKDIQNDYLSFIDTLCDETHELLKGFQSMKNMFKPRISKEKSKGQRSEDKTKVSVHSSTVQQKFESSPKVIDTLNKNLHCLENENKKLLTESKNKDSEIKILRDQCRQLNQVSLKDDEKNDCIKAELAQNKSEINEMKEKIFQLKESINSFKGEENQRDLIQSQQDDENGNMLRNMIKDVLEQDKELMYDLTKQVKSAHSAENKLITLQQKYAHITSNAVDKKKQRVPKEKKRTFLGNELETLNERIKDLEFAMEDVGFNVRNMEVFKDLREMISDTKNSRLSGKNNKKEISGKIVDKVIMKSKDLSTENITADRNGKNGKNRKSKKRSKSEEPLDRKRFDIKMHEQSRSNGELLKHSQESGYAINRTKQANNGKNCYKYQNEDLKQISPSSTDGSCEESEKTDSSGRKSKSRRSLIELIRLNYEHIIKNI